VSWRSIQRIGQNPGRGSGSSRRAQKTPVKVTAAAASQMITPTTRTHGVVAMMPAMATPNPRYPSRSAQTAILQCRLVRSPASSSTPNGLLGVVYGHVLRNALLPVVTVVGYQFGTLLGGAVLTETVFGWPGMGQLLVDALFARDYPVVQGIVLTFSALFILVNLAVDVLYGAIDPRIHYA